MLKTKKWVVPLLMVAVMCFTSLLSYAQPTDDGPGDPGSISIFTVQNLSFGAFGTGINGGKITIAANGNRSVSGDIIPFNLNIAYFNAIFEIEAPKGTVISILNGPDATLTGSNGGSMTMRIGNSDPLSPFITTAEAPGRTRINIGGTLTVNSPASNPPGNYSGNFYITFNQE